MRTSCRHVDTHAQMYTCPCTHVNTLHTPRFTHSQPLHTRGHSPPCPAESLCPMPMLCLSLSQLGGASGGQPSLDSCADPSPSPRAGCAEGHSGPGRRQLLEETPGPCPGGLLLPVQALVKVAGPQLSPFPVKRQSQARPDRAGHAWEALHGIGSCRAACEPGVVGTEPTGEWVSSATTPCPFRLTPSLPYTPDSLGTRAHQCGSCRPR